MVPDVGSLTELSLEALARAATSFPQSAYLDLLARRASGGSLDADQVKAQCRRPAAPSQPWDGRALAWFGLAVGASDDADLADVDAIFEVASRLLGGPDHLGPRMIRLWIEVLHHLGHLVDADPALTDASAGANRIWCATTDALNPHLADQDLPIGPWLNELSRPFTESGLAPLQLRPTGATPFDRVTADADPIAGVNVPLVSVVMPVYRPGLSLVSAVRSILNQTWTNLEVLLCDDASPDDSRALLEECAELDSRVRIIRSPHNGGAYHARNLGLGRARGEFVTFQDFDDWSHPQRVERQMLPLLEDTSLHAILSQALGVDANLGLTALGRGPRRLNVSSLLFRRFPVLERLGGFDTVRRGADTEFLRRLETVFGAGAVRELDECLALIQLTADSLSRNDYGLLRRNPARREYRALYRRWHQQIANGQQSSFVLPPVRARFPAPAYISGGTDIEPRRCDVVLIANLGAEPPLSVDLGREIAALSADGSKVGLIHCPGPRDLVGSAPHAVAAVDAPSPSVAARILAGAAFQVMLGERVVARRAIVRDPGALLAHGPAIVTNIDAHEVVLIADYLPGSSWGYDPGAVDALVRDRLGAVPTWLPTTAGVASQLPDVRARAPRLWAQAASRPITGGRPPGPPVLGVVARNTQPDKKAVPREPSTTVWVWGRSRVPLGRPAVTMSASEMTLESFLRQVSYVVIPTSPGLGPHLHPLAVAALENGCVPVLDPSFEQHFGSAAFYPSRSLSIDAWIHLHTVRPELYVEQQKRGVEFVTGLSLATSNLEAAQA